MDRKQPLVSIALVVYNGEALIRQQLDSLYNQTYKNIEVIVTDDRSTDGTVQILEEYAQKYGLKYYVNETNLKYTRNCERAASYCKGEYIAWCDHDDIWHPEKIETLVNNIGERNFIFSDEIVIDENNNIIADSLKQYSNIPIPKDNQLTYLLFKCIPYGHQIMIKRELTDKIFPMPEKFESLDWWMGIVGACHGGMEYVDKPLAKYRLHSSNISGTKPYKYRLWDKLKFYSRFFSEEKKAARKRIYKALKQNAEVILSSSALNLNEKERKTVEQASKYFDFWLGNGISAEAICFAYENRNVIFHTNALAKKTVAIALWIPYLVLGSKK